MCTSALNIHAIFMWKNVYKIIIISTSDTERDFYANRFYYNYEYNVYVGRVN